MKKEISATDLKNKTAMVKKIAMHYFNETSRKIDFKTSGITNYVFEIDIPSGCYIIRIGNSPEKIRDYQKEQWATQHVKALHVPVAEIIEVGNDVVSAPYMIQKKIEGREATDHTNHLR